MKHVEWSILLFHYVFGYLPFHTLVKRLGILTINRKTEMSLKDEMIAKMLYVNVLYPVSCVSTFGLFSIVF